MICIVGAASAVLLICLKPRNHASEIIKDVKASDETVNGYYQYT